jgi:hypothetical protein
MGGELRVCNGSSELPIPHDEADKDREGSRESKRHPLIERELS